MWKLLLTLGIIIFSLNCHGEGKNEDIGNLPEVTIGKNYLVRDLKAFNAQVPLLQAGDTITLARGIWKNCSFKFYGEGTIFKPIVMQVEEYGKTSIEGASSLNIYGNHLIIDGLLFKEGYSSKEKLIEFRKDNKTFANHCILRNCVIEDSFNRSNFDEKNAWINLFGIGNVIESCYFGKKTNLGVVLIVWLDEKNKENNHLIQNNYFAGRPKPATSTNGLETIRIGTSEYSMEVSGTIIESNYFEYADGETEIISVKSGENKILNNTFFESQGSVVLRHGNRNVVSGNYFIGNGKKDTGGIRIINEGHKIVNNYFYQLRGKGYRAPLCIMKGIANTPLNGYLQVKDVDILFNTWIDCDITWALSFGNDKGQDLTPLNVVLADNLVYSEQQVDLMEVYDDISGIKFQSNVMKNKNGFLQEEGFINSHLVTHKDQNLLYWMIPTQLVDRSESVIVDIEGKMRNSQTHIGALDINQNSRTKSMATRENSGPQWYK